MKDRASLIFYLNTFFDIMEEQKSAKAGCFVPVDPQFALDYHGNTFSIDGIRIETEDGVNGGLFGNAVTVGKVMIDGCYVGGLIGCVTGNKKLEFQDCYFVGNIDRRGKTEKQDGGPTISRDWLGNTGIMAGNRSMPAVNLAAVPGEESMSNILSSGNENNADKTFSFSADLSWSSYPYKIWTKNGEDQTVYYGDWIDWKKLQ